MKKIITKDGSTYEIMVDPTQVPFIERLLSGKTESDKKIEALNIPDRPFWLRFIIRSIRLYRRKIAHKLGHRCVFEPSCSHYSEMVFRKYGLLKGIKMTIQRLLRCRPGRGGIDLP